MSDTYVCDDCGNLRGIGLWPWCPHGKVAGAVVPDDVPGGFWAENGFDTPQKFYSRSAHEAALAARGLEIRAKYAGDGYEKHLTRWDAVSPKQLEDAKILLERGAQARQSRLDELNAAKAEFPITVRDLKPHEVGR